MLAIETSDLSKRFKRMTGYRDLILYPWRRREIVALRGISLSVSEGELYGLLGQNGAGKSTLIRILCTTLLPSAGVARVLGHDVVAEPRKVRRLIGLVQSEERSFYWRLSGRHNLEFFAALYQIPRSVARGRIDDLLDRLELQEEASRPYFSLSTGTRQKFAIMRGLMTEPRVLFLDEPTRSLDPISAESVRRFISERIVTDLGSTVILATHSLQEAEQLCTRLALIRDGEIVSEGTSDELRRSMSPGMRCELHLRTVSPDLAMRLERIRGVVAVTGSTALDESRLSVELDHRPEALTEILEVVLSSGSELIDLVTHRPSLEEVYIRTLTKSRAGGGPPQPSA
jgi:ABC-2 type transport system ATP-binding protein